ncbi:sodium:phosphate symporter [Clostridioides difficile]|uniref:Na/Pi cotransporter family protein n=14 Tax=Clostridioides difficile TaxID=1496 RepID=UPI001024EF27|nr:Na/Pi cotransporter family protein [Clostridioides difficile]VFD68452.1 sodium:phosphate symporter [Clostridioides difficile]
MNIIISLMGGLGLFLYGMNLMGEGLQKSAGTKLKKIIKLLTSNLFMGVLVGTGVTAVIQSSSATTVMVVGFVNAGIMTLKQAIGVIMGANIGTTVTAQLVSFDLTGMAPVALGVGIILYLFGNKPRIKNIAEILIGFGILFTGMDFMKMAVEPLRDYQGFTDLLVTFGRYPLLGLLLGFGITAIIQSSSASMGMLVALAAEGLVPLSAALPILYGQNIGTCVTSLLSSIGANKNARRAAMMHLIFNVLGTVIFLIFLNKPVVSMVTSWDPSNVARQIANTHTLFNIISVLILLPFTSLIIKLAIKLVPDRAGDIDEDETKTIKYIDDRMIETPSIALANTIKEALRMGEKAKESLNASMEALVEHSTEKIDKTYRRERLINDLQKAILNYLLKLSKAPLDDDSREVVDTLFNTVNDIERIGDHAKNIAEILIGFGILFTGMDFMKMAVEPLRDYQGFTDLLVTFGRYPLLGLLLGFGITAIIQSSSASMGMLVALAAEGLVPLSAALPILYGQNIGTCVTSLLSSIGANKNARRAAMMHLIFNVLGTVIFLIFLNKPVVSMVTSWDPSNVARQIANTHTLFNIISVLILLPFTNLIIKLAIKLVPDRAGDIDEDETKTIKYIDDRMIETPSIALANTIKEALRMGEKAKESLNASMEALVEHSTEKIDKTYRRERLINDLQKAILNYLLKLSKAPLDDDSREVVDTLFNTVNDIERIGDHAKNIAELSQVAIDSNISFSEEGQSELDVMYNRVVSAYTYALESMRTDNVDLACKVIKIEEQVDIMEKSCRANHMYRLNNNLCSIENGVIYLDVISNLERISDHAVNIAQQVIAKRLGND